MKPGGQKSKGNTQERKTARALSDWSGLKMGRNVLTETGDLMTPLVFPFSVECKHYAEINFWHIFTSKHSLLEKFWDQASRDAANLTRDWDQRFWPMLSIKQNRSAWLMGLSKEVVDKAFYDIGLDYISIRVSLATVFFFDFEKVLEAIPYKTIQTRMRAI